MPPNSDMPEHILIAGGGIGGLSAAMACSIQGARVTVFDTHTPDTDDGAGIQLTPNAMRVAGALGIQDRLLKDAVAPRAITLRDGKTGQIMSQSPLGDHISQRYGAPYLHVHRGDLIRALTERARNAGVTLRYGEMVTGYTNTDAGVTAHLESGEAIGADLLIGADGLASTIRSQMLNLPHPPYSGYVAWRCTVETAKLSSPPLPEACSWLGSQQHAVTYRLRSGTLTNFVGVMRHPGDIPESWRQDGDIAEARRAFSRYHSIVTDILDTADQLRCWPLFDRHPLPRWSDGPVVLLGDAAHPILPFLAQGAAMAMEDSYVLARCLSETSFDLARALTTFEHLRKPRTSMVQARSRHIERVHHSPWLIRQGIRVTSRLFPRIIERAMDDIYGYDATSPTLLETSPRP